MADAPISKFARELARAIDDARKNLGLSKADIARELGISAQVLTNANTRLRAFGPATAVRLTEVLQLPTDRSIAFLRCYLLEDKFSGMTFHGMIEELLNGIDQLPPEVARNVLKRAFSRIPSGSDGAPSAHKK